MKIKNIFTLLLLFFSFLMHAQRDSINNGGVYYCSRDIFEIIKEDKKHFGFRLPEDFEGDSIDYKTDSAVVFLANRNYLQHNYASGKLKFRTLVDDEKKSFIIENLISKQKGKIDFTESCEIIFTGTKYYYEDKEVRFFFKAKFDGHVQDLSLSFGKLRGKKLLIINCGHPSYIKCEP